MAQQHSNLPTQPERREGYEDFENRMIRTLGATVGGEVLTRALGYPSQGAFQKAHRRGRVPVTTFEVEGRRGRFASVLDIAAWLWCQRSHQLHPTKHSLARLT